MKLPQFDLYLQKIVLLAFLASCYGTTWAASSTCTYLKPIPKINDAAIGGTGMGGTGISGTGASTEAEQGAIQLAGNVIYSQGKVKATSKGRSRQLVKGDSVCVGETIVTSQSGKLQIKMTDEGFVAIRPGTQLTIEKYSYSGTAEDTSVFSLLNGASRFVTGKIGKMNPQNDLIRTQTATIGVRGTDHEVTVILPGDDRGYLSGTYDRVNAGVTFIRTEKGEIDVQPNQVGLAANIGEMPTLLKDIPDFYIPASSLEEKGNLSETGHKEEGLRENFIEDSSTESSGKEIGLEHPSEVGASSAEHAGNRIDMDHPESHGLPELPESLETPELPESPETPELPESPDITELPDQPDVPEMPERPEE